MKQLLVRADDMGVCDAFILGCASLWQTGVVRSIELIAPAPAAHSAVSILRDVGMADVGVHVCLTSEWPDLRWKPLTGGRSLVDDTGNLPQTIAAVRERVDLAEAESEIMAQVEWLVSQLPLQVTHISGHMYCGSARPEIAAAMRRAAKSFGLALDFDCGINAVKFPADAAAFVDIPTGRSLLIVHPSAGECPLIPANVLVQRNGQFVALRKRDTAMAIRRADIRLIGYRDLSA